MGRAAAAGSAGRDVAVAEGTDGGAASTSTSTPSPPETHINKDLID